MNIVIVLCALAIVVSTASFSAPSTDINTDLEWIKFKIEFNKTYKNKKEELFRKNVFIDNCIIIKEHNELYKKGLKTYELGINTYSDLTHQEFVTKMNGFKRNYIKKNQAESAMRFLIPGNAKVPDVIDYRTKGYVTPVKNQGSCSSDWAFSTVGMLEGQNYRMTKKLLSLSVQDLIDCSTAYGNNGCNGGSVDNAFRYVSKEGINSENLYPYEAKAGRCRRDLNDTAAAAGASTGRGGLVDVPADEAALKAAVGLLGPTSAIIDGSRDGFRSYKSGVYRDHGCSSADVNHAVLVVGYGTAGGTGGDYWIVKNSWGAGWGDGGYALMARNSDNNCGIATAASVPVP